jgi:hypothetical protein
MTTKQLTREALRKRKQNSLRVGTVPFGYFLSHDGRTLIEDAGQQFWLREMRLMRANGKTLREIAERLQQAGVKTAKGLNVWREKNNKTNMRKRMRQ